MASQETAKNEIFLDQVGFAYDGKRVLDRLTAKIPSRDFAGIIGPNGAGKSTLLRLMCRIFKSDTGQVTLQGRSIDEYSQKDLAKILAVLPAETFISYDFTVEEIVRMGRSPHLNFWSEGGEKDEKIVETSIKAVGISHLSDRSIHSLSSGERQMVFLAQAMAQQPKILLLDEPTVHLDIRHQLQIFQILKDWNASDDLTIVVISHDINVASLYCKRLILMHEGKIKMEGTPKEVITEKNINEVYGISTKVVTDPETGIPSILFK